MNNMHCLFNFYAEYIMRNSRLEEAQAGIKIAGRNINHLRYAGRRQWHLPPVLLPGKSRGQRSLVGYSPWGREELDTTERLHFLVFPTCIGEGNGNPLQCSCLENPRDGGAWWAAVSGVAQSQTRLKRLSSSSSGAFCLLGFIFPQHFLKVMALTSMKQNKYLFS